MRIITDSAADFTPDKLERYRIRCVPMQVIFGQESISAAGYAVDEHMLTALGPTLAAHIGPGAYGAAFVAED